MTDGALAAETPTAASDLKIILSGKFLEPGQVLDGAGFCLASLCTVHIAQLGVFLAARAGQVS